MIYTHFIGRIGKDAQLITGTHGNFMSVDLAVDNYAKGEKITTWVRVRSKRENHISLCKYLTKGKVILVEGVLNEPTIWTDKEGNNHVQLSISSDSINFVNIGKKKEETTADNTEQSQTPVETATATTNDKMPFDAPKDTDDDLPF